MISFYVKLSEEEASALAKFSWNKERTPNDQINFIVKQELIRNGYLPLPEPPPYPKNPGFQLDETFQEQERIGQINRTTLLHLLKGDLNSRVLNNLVRGGLKYVGQVVDLWNFVGPDAFYPVKDSESRYAAGYLGKTSIENLRKYLLKHGLINE